MRQTAIQRMAQAMADELERNRLTVVLTPAEREDNVGARVRTVVGENPEWYQKLCAAHPTTRVRKNRAPDTKIKRGMTIRALRAIHAGRVQRAMHFGEPTYREWLLPIIRAEVAADKAQRAEIRAAEAAPF